MTEASADSVVKETTTAGFRQDVIAESMRQPVLVDFWAPWCGPCKQLTPAIEKVVKAAKGKIKLVKMNIDEHPQVAGQLGVQSIPAVFAFDRGQPVDGFVGALPESQLKGFIERLIGPIGPSNIETLLAKGNAALDAADPAGAAQLFAGALAEDGENLAALGGLVRAHLAGGNIETAQRLLEQVPAAKQNDPALAGAKAALDLALQPASLGDLADLMGRIEADPNDHQARFDLALALNAQNQRQAAAAALLEIIKRDRIWNEDGARKQLLQFFEAWGPMDEATIGGRRRLSALLFA